MTWCFHLLGPLGRMVHRVPVWFHLFVCMFVPLQITKSKRFKTRRGSPVDNRPSTDKLHRFVKKKKVTCDTWHVTHDMWHVTCGMWHVTCDILWWVKILNKFQLPSSYGLWFIISWRLGGKCSRTDLINQLMTKVFVEQPRLHKKFWSKN